MIEDSDDEGEASMSCGLRADFGERGKSFVGHFKKKKKIVPLGRTLQAVNKFKKKRKIPFGKQSELWEDGDSDDESDVDADDEEDSLMGSGEEFHPRSGRGGRAGRKRGAGGRGGTGRGRSGGGTGRGP